MSFFLSPVCSASVVIGAPKASTRQVNVTEGGSVFYCPWSLSQSECHTIEFDTEGKSYDGSTNSVPELCLVLMMVIGDVSKLRCSCCQQQVWIGCQRSAPLTCCRPRWFLNVGCSLLFPACVPSSGLKSLMGVLKRCFQGHSSLPPGCVCVALPQQLQGDKQLINK